MMERYIYKDWEQPPEEMDFEMRYADLILDLIDTMEILLPQVPVHDGEKKDREFYEDMLRLYLRAPAVPSLMLNYKICIEFGLPLYPDTYVPFNTSAINSRKYDDTMKDHVQQQYLDSIRIARQLYALEVSCVNELENFYSQLPQILKDSWYINKKDKYTWMASRPADIRVLADSIENELGKVDLILGAAHGSIRSGLVLANMLDTDLYFIRFSLFKRKDANPIISKQDIEVFTHYKDKKVVLFDEDMAKGKTMKEFRHEMSSFFENFSTATVTRHYLTPEKTDFVGDLRFD